MTPRDVNAASGTENISEADADRLLSGGHPQAGSLSDVGHVLTALRTSADMDLDPSRVDAMASLLAAAALTAPDAAGVGLQARGTRRAGETRVRIATVVAAAIALLVGTAGVGAAAQDALPGDALYAVKRALEDVGIYEGGLDERAQEASELAERGDEDAALEHLADSLEDEGDLESAESVRNAAEAVLSGGSEQSLAVRTAVSAMLQWMADTDLTGREFGQAVAERARAIHTADEDDAVEGDEAVEPDVAGKPENPGKPDDAGKPETPGKPDDAGKPETPGKPDDAGKPETPGKPDDAGKPDNPGKPEDAGKPDTAGGKPKG